MTSTLGGFLAAVTGYPGRWCLLLGLASGLLWCTWDGYQLWETESRRTQTTLEAELSALLDTRAELEPSVLTQDPRIRAASIHHADGTVSRPGQSAPDQAWAPTRRFVYSLRDGAKLQLRFVPIPPKDLLSRLIRQSIPPLGLTLGLSLLIAILLRRPLRLLEYWLEELDQGNFGQHPPELPAPLGRIGQHLRVLAERLRHTRGALQERQSASDRQHRDRIRQLQNELDQLRQDQQAQSTLGDARGELLRTMSHEMRTPLTAIIGYADLLGGQDASAEAVEYAGVIGRSARNLLGMINNLLDLARIEAGHLEQQQNGFNLTELVEDTVALLAPLAFDKKLELNTLIYHDVPERLLGDPLRIAQILTNLLSNAIKYTDQGEVIVRVLHDRSGDAEIQLRLEVADTGRGLSDEQQQKLFQAWRRFEMAGSTAGGSGLGLAIVHKLLDLLGGHIEVESTPNEGSVFSAVIPCGEEAGVQLRLPWDGLRNVRVWACEPHETAARTLSHLLTFWQVDFRLWPHLADLHAALTESDSPADAELLVLGLDTRGENASMVNDILSLTEDLRPPTLVLVPSIDARTHQLWRERGAQAVLAKAVQRSSLYDVLGQMTGQSPGSGPSVMADMPVLVADNNRAGLRILQTQLEKLGAIVTCTEDGAEALREWKQNTFELALIDMHMPKLDGRECAQQMRSSGQNEGATLVGMSAWLDTAEEHAWRDAGVDTVLIKPFDMERLLRALRHSRESVAAQLSKPAPTGLMQDSELSALLLEELPQQWQTLDEAFITGEFTPVRDAAHQLHGTAAFFHLQPLQTELAQFERLLSSARHLDDPQLPVHMARIQVGVREILRDLGADYSAE